MKASSPLGFDGVSIHYSRPNIPLSKRESRWVTNFLEPLCIPRFKPQSTSWYAKLPVLINDLVDHPVFLGLLGIHDVIALDVLLYAVHLLAPVLCQQRIDLHTHAQNLFRVQIDVRRLPAEPRHPRLVNQDALIWQREPFFRRAASKQ